MTMARPEPGAGLVTILVNEAGGRRAAGAGRIRRLPVSSCLDRISHAMHSRASRAKGQVVGLVDQGVEVGGFADRFDGEALGFVEGARPSQLGACRSVMTPGRAGVTGA